MKEHMSNADEAKRIGFKTQQEVIKHGLNYFTQATLKDTTEDELEKDDATSK